LKIFQILIVGAGPAGYFATQAFQNRETEGLNFKIDLVEKLPTPWGLVRSGVAPDHQKIKSISKIFEKISQHKNFRLFANVKIDLDSQIEELIKNYDAVILAIGASRGKKLNIQGENLLNVFSSAEFVPWYNAHPDFESLKVNFSSNRAVIIGSGNVALDVARILVKDVDELSKTDINLKALGLLKSSKIKEVVICGRRGPENCKFSLNELRDLSKLHDISIHFDEKEVSESIVRLEKENSKDFTEIKNKLDFMLNVAKQNDEKCAKKIIFKFSLRPVSIEGSEKVRSVKFVSNENPSISSDDSKNELEIDCGLVVSCIGYETESFNKIESENGKLKNVDGKIFSNLYCVGWAKRGSSGVIGTNKSDAIDVVKLIIEELSIPKNTLAPEDCLKSRNIIVSQEMWETINNRELELGAANGTPRVKIAKIEELISLSRL
jgi:ferredoxin--NADP+ reductase